MNQPALVETRLAEDNLERFWAAQALVKTDHRRAMEALNLLFSQGTTPSVDGRCAGQLVALDIAPGVTPLLENFTRSWMPWKGKTFDAGRALGDNIFLRSSWRLAHVLWPFYRGYADDGADTFRAFAFRTYVAPGKADPNLQVLKIDYDLAGNPGFSIRRVLDELVEIGPGVYLGKAYFHFWWNRWQMVAFFLLRQPTDGSTA